MKRDDILLWLWIAWLIGLSAAFGVIFVQLAFPPTNVSTTLPISSQLPRSGR